MNDADSKKLERYWVRNSDLKRWQMRDNPKEVVLAFRYDAKLKEQDREIERLREENNSLWAQKDMQHKLEKAEAALADARKVYTAHGTEAEKQIDELQARVKELEQELSWAADACEKAEKLLVEKEKV